MRYDDREMSLLKNTFAENEALLKAIRKSMLQMDVDSNEKGLLQIISKNEALSTLVRKAFLPELDGDAPLHQIIDLWMTVEIKDKDPYMVKLIAQSREKLIKYLDQEIKVLSGSKRGTLKFVDLIKLGKKTDDEIFVDLTVRNTILAHIELQLNQFKMLSGMREETVEETITRLRSNSSK